MADKLIELTGKRAVLVKEAESIVESGEDMSEEATALYEEKMKSIEQIDAQIKRLNDIQEKIKAAPVIRKESNGAPKATPGIEASFRSFGNMRAFENNSKGKEQALRFGQWFRAISGYEDAVKFCKEQDIPLSGSPYAVHQSTVPSKGGALVPVEFSNRIIDLQETYGAFRANTDVVPMSTDKLVQSKVTAGLTAYWVNEGEQITKSNITTQNVDLVLKDMHCLALVSNDLMQDAIINLGDRLALQMARAFAYKEDQAAFLGDGTSTYGQVTGLCTRILANAGTHHAYDTGYAWSNIANSDLTSAMSKITPSWAMQNAKWFCSHTFYYSVMVPLAAAAGGNTFVTLANGMPTPAWLGYPVVFTSAMPTAAATSKIQVIFGDLSLASQLGDRGERRIAFSDSAVVDSRSAFERNETAIRATQRIDIVVHDYGSAATGAAVAGLESHSS